MSSYAWIYGGERAFSNKYRGRWCACGCSGIPPSGCRYMEGHQLAAVDDQTRRKRLAQRRWRQRARQIAKADHE
jgi:hypothetical protein